MPKNSINPQRIKSVQRHLDIADIKEGVITLKDGTLRAVLMVSSINFALKSIDEQDAIIHQYQAFLNSLDFSVQIIVSSRALNIDNYLQSLETKEKEQTNELLRIQIAEYLQFIKGLVQMTSIVSKTFYIIVPFALSEEKGKGIFGKVKAGLKSKAKITYKEKNFKRYKDQLFQRVDHIIGNLSGVGIRMTPLNTQELIELYYSLYNPGVSERRGLVEISELDIAQ